MCAESFDVKSSQVMGAWNVHGKFVLNEQWNQYAHEHNPLYRIHISSLILPYCVALHIYKLLLIIRHLYDTNLNNLMRFVILRAVLKVPFFLDISLFVLVNGYHCFGIAFHLHLQDSWRGFRQTIRSLVCINNINTIKSVYYAYFHSITKYGMILWGNCSNSGSTLYNILQKKIIRIMAGTQPRTSCRSLFKQLEILHVPCQYILSLINFIINNQENFQTNASLHNINTRNKHHLHRTNANLSCCQKRWLEIKWYKSASGLCWWC